jgi:TolA-binding protein
MLLQNNNPKNIYFEPGSGGEVQQQVQAPVESPAAPKNDTPEKRAATYANLEQKINSLKGKVDATTITNLQSMLKDARDSEKDNLDNLSSKARADRVENRFDRILNRIPGAAATGPQEIVLPTLVVTGRAPDQGNRRAATTESPSAPVPAPRASAASGAEANSAAREVSPSSIPADVRQAARNYFSLGENQGTGISRTFSARDGSRWQAVYQSNGGQGSIDYKKIT